MTRYLKSRLALGALASMLAIWSLANASQLAAQAEGNNAVVQGTSISYSTSYIDAGAVTGTSSQTDICAKINAALGLISSTFPSAVIDARGINSGLTCPAGDTPWSYGTSTFAKAATILLPARTIVINTGWALPSGARIVGEGGGASSSSATGGITTIQACKSGVSGCTQNLSGAMLAMGTASTAYCPSNVCTGVSIENLWLDGQGLSVNGIVNNYAQEQSTVKHVTLYQIGSSGLGVSPPTGVTGTPQNSGPYVDINCLAGSAPTSSTVCARILGVSTRGIHGITCINTSSTIPTNAIALDASNNSIEDVKVQGFEYGIRVGASGTAKNDLLLNVSGGNDVSSVVLISNANTVSDITILGVGNGGTGGATDTITDNRTSPTTVLSDATVAMYVLGQQLTAGGTNIGYSRFTTSPSVPTWSNGNGTPSGSCKTGSLYSNTTGQSGSTWYLCGPTGAWSNVR